MSTETSIHLYVGKNDRRDVEKTGYYLILSGSSMWRTAEVEQPSRCIWAIGISLKR